MNPTPLPPLPPLPLDDGALQRIRARVHQEARVVRAAVAEAAVHGIFALASLAWAASVAFG
jgi:hypothetical protein